MIQNSKFLGIKIMCFEISMLGRFTEMLKVFSKFEICLLYKLFWVLGCFSCFCDIKFFYDTLFLWHFKRKHYALAILPSSPLLVTSYMGTALLWHLAKVCCTIYWGWVVGGGILWHIFCCSIIAPPCDILYADCLAPSQSLLTNVHPTLVHTIT